MKKLPIGIQNFRKIIEGDYIYIDKTQYVYDLIDNASYYFLSRPRRFGKSLLLDTIAEVFSGDKELFKGLWIYDSGYAFPKHPVIRLDMSRIANENPAILKESILSRLKEICSAEGLEIEDTIVSDVFAKLISLLCKKYDQRVVVLIDEYDKPILDHITEIDLADENRKVLRGFYGILKSMDACLRFTLITGVTKFSKTFVFSELNNLSDITLHEDFAGICGIPVESLDTCFGEHMESLAASKNLSRYESIRDGILAWYDGYSWDGETRLINPFSLLSFFSARRFSGFWYASGTPGFLVDMIKRKPETFLTLKNLEMSERVLDLFDIRSMEIEPLLFQTGYLTVESILLEYGPPIYRLTMPNLEVREAFSLQVMAELTEKGDFFAETAYRRMKESLAEGDLQKMLDILRGLFASIPYELHVKQEAYYHSIFYAVMSVLGFDVDAEVSVSKGRVDAVLALEDKVYVMEFKYEACPPDASDEAKQKLFSDTLDEAMAQIGDRGYADRYRGSGKSVVRAAFAFLGRDEIEMRVEL